MHTTLATSTRFTGTGLHTGQPVTVVVHPAEAGHGIVFRRTDIGPRALIPAKWNAARQVPLCTMLVGDTGAEVRTVEHLMAAMAGCGISNALIDIDGPEVPILDGSSAEFVRGFLATGLARQSAPRQAIRILQPVTAQNGDAWARLSPGRNTLDMDFRIDFDDAAIGRQSKRLSLANGAFVRELCECRTFCRKADIDAMHARGLALGGTYDNAVVVDGADVVSPGGLRFEDEPVRHKMLDALGDLALAGAPILGRYTGYKAGHSLTNQLLHELFAAPEAWEMVTVDAAIAHQLPGARLDHADLARVA